MRCRYFGIQTMWYSVRYAVCPDSRISTRPFYHLISPSHTFTHVHSTWASALRVSLDQKNVTAWLDLRNKAAHGLYDQYNREQVETMLKGVIEFSARTAS